MARAEIFGKNLKRQMRLSGITQADIVRRLGVSKSTVSVWANGANIPRADKMEQLCQMFGIKFSDLLEEKSPPPSDELSGEQKRFLETIKQLPEEKLALVEDLAIKLLNM